MFLPFLLKPQLHSFARLHLLQLTFICLVLPQFQTIHFSVSFLLPLVLLSQPLFQQCSRDTILFCDFMCNFHVLQCIQCLHPTPNPVSPFISLGNIMAYNYCFFYYHTCYCILLLLDMNLPICRILPILFQGVENVRLS